MTDSDTNPQFVDHRRAHWLALGAASAGVGAALLGFALLGPQTGVAAADGAGETSASAGPSTAHRSESTRTTGAQRRAERRAARAETRAARRADRTVDAEPASGDREVQAGATVSATATPTATLTTTRRTLFDKAPTVTPMQLTGQVDGPITGTIGATDPEGDPLTYRIRRAPREGSVQLADDGTYTYTPNGQFDGVDTFRVAVLDGSPFRPWGTSATSLINQGAITFQFRYTDGGTTWTPERQQALQDVARQLTGYFMVNAPVTLTYDVGVESDPGSLASAGSNLTSGYAGFWRTVVQNKLLSGVDSNGAAADGVIDWNFSYAWGLDASISADEYDFTSTATARTAALVRLPVRDRQGGQQYRDGRGHRTTGSSWRPTATNRSAPSTPGTPPTIPVSPAPAAACSSAVRTRSRPTAVWCRCTRRTPGRAAVP